MSALKAIIKSHIQQHGPMGIDQYMELCLSHPEHGYYMKKDPFGKDGDFTTAPEISQLFGDMLGLWALNAYRRLGSPKRIHLIEAGPGRGTLMSDMLRIACQDKAFNNAVTVHMIETSEKLKKTQQLALSYKEHIPAHWHGNLSTVNPDGPVIIIANELFDALPTKQYVFVKNIWHERVVGLDENEQLMLGMQDAPHASGFVEAYALEEPSPLKIFEHSPAREHYIKQMAELIKQHQGCGLFIDYGHAKSDYGDTLQAMRGHAYSDILKDCGDADLTSHVDFAALVKAINHHPGCKDISISNIVTQGAFLGNLGIELWADKLSTDHNLEGENLTHFMAGLQRLTAADQMGKLFKVMHAEYILEN